jgi:tetratricopeptide (TPR) repeat protein
MNYPEAIEFYNRALNYQLENIALLNNIGIIYLELGKYNDALDSFIKAKIIKENRNENSDDVYATVLPLTEMDFSLI